MSTPFTLRSALALALAAAMTPAVAGSEDEVAYSVRAGETLIGISRAVLVEPHQWVRLQTLNRIVDPYHIMPGTVLRIPAAMMRRDPATASVVAVSGDVRANGNALSANAKLEGGANLSTGDQSFATIELIDGSRLVLQPRSRMTIEELSRFRNTNSLQSRFRLDAGRLESIVTKTAAPRPRYTVDTPAASMGVRGTRFRVGSDDASGASQAEVTDGTVGVQGGGGKAAAVGAGFGVLASASGQVSPPVALLPAPDVAGLPQLQERTVVRFAVPPQAGAHAYRFQVGADAQMRQVLAENTSAKPEAKFGDLPDGQYLLRVRGVDAQGLEGRDADFAFHLKARPEPPFVVAPVGGSKQSAETIDLSWTSNPDATHYRIQLARNDRFADPVTDIDVAATSIRPLPKLPPGEYWWRARSLRGDGDTGPWGDAQRFILKPVP
ncbi:MAG TPA: FecR domain-containing protein, partial [Rhodocyclaceae bacterium]|nr:FecR domain-containing protein [Rhodocyclaceae bacterium]